MANNSGDDSNHTSEAQQHPQQHVEESTAIPPPNPRPERRVSPIVASWCTPQMLPFTVGGVAVASACASVFFVTRIANHFERKQGTPEALRAEMAQLPAHLQRVPRGPHPLKVLPSAGAALLAVGLVSFGAQALIQTILTPSSPGYYHPHTTDKEWVEATKKYREACPRTAADTPVPIKGPF